MTCLFFVVGGFIEFAFVLQLQQYNEKHMTKPRITTKFDGYGLRPIRSKHHRIKPSENSEFNVIPQVFDVRKIDIIAFAVVCLLFILFNVIYWVTFLGFTSHNETK